MLLAVRMPRNQPADSPDMEPLMDSATTDGAGTKKRTYLPIMVLVFLCSLTTNIVLLATLYSRMQVQRGYILAEEAVVDKVITFDTNFNGKLAIYEQSPSQAVDDLGRICPVVPVQTAMNLPNSTFPIPGQSDRTVISLSVLHQLHCLDVARRAMRPERYPDMATDDEKTHIRHCLSELRQSLMCTADISPIVWQWSERAQAPKERADIAHSCRDFERIWEWSRDHAFRGQARKVG